MEYYTYWSVLKTPGNSIKPYSVFLIILILSMLAFFSVLKFQKKDDDRKIHLALISLFIALSLPCYIYLKFFNHDHTAERISKLLESDTLKKVEGSISNYKRASEGKSVIESFEVNSVTFTYDDHSLYEFNHFGGNRSNDLYDGLKVRITYSKGNKFNEIMKIEFQKQIK